MNRYFGALLRREIITRMMPANAKSRERAQSTGSQRLSSDTVERDQSRVAEGFATAIGKAEFAQDLVTGILGLDVSTTAASNESDNQLPL
jgi:hypothetical protein